MAMATYLETCSANNVNVFGSFDYLAFKNK